MLGRSGPIAEAEPAHQVGRVPTRPFLTARWLNLVMANYEVPPALLEPLVPAGTHPDPWQGSAYLSLVAFQFRDTRVWGVPIPLHRNFEEVNLRFYVRRDAGADSRRGVVFIKETVPRLAVALGARLLYNEPYQALPMRSVINAEGVERGEAGHLYYGWGHTGRRFSLSASIGGPPVQPPEGSFEQFITEHYWGYNRQRNGSTLEYRVDHPAWRVWQARSVALDGDVTAQYGPMFGPILAKAPKSGFVAEGSEVSVYPGRRV
jgi:uncharacterized protein YqjF (DUF2071 family)